MHIPVLYFTQVVFYITLKFSIRSNGNIFHSSFSTYIVIYYTIVILACLLSQMVFLFCTTCILYVCLMFGNAHCASVQEEDNRCLELELEQLWATWQEGLEGKWGPLEVQLRLTWGTSRHSATECAKQSTNALMS